jgi:hypothetical protein
MMWFTGSGGARPDEGGRAPFGQDVFHIFFIAA